LAAAAAAAEAAGADMTFVGVMGDIIFMGDIGVDATL
jgi:hypothetical protein